MLQRVHTKLLNIPFSIVKYFYITRLKNIFFFFKKANSMYLIQVNEETFRHLTGTGSAPQGS